VCSTRTRTKSGMTACGLTGSVLFWYFRIYLKATVPARNRCSFLAPCESTTGVDLRTAFAPMDFRWVFPSVDFRATDSFVLATEQSDVIVAPMNIVT
jgi:hypothetical protein